MSFQTHKKEIDFHLKRDKPVLRWVLKSWSTDRPWNWKERMERDARLYNLRSYLINLLPIQHKDRSFKSQKNIILTSSSRTVLSRSKVGNWERSSSKTTKSEPFTAASWSSKQKRKNICGCKSSLKQATAKDIPSNLLWIISSSRKIMCWIASRLRSSLQGAKSMIC